MLKWAAQPGCCASGQLGRIYVKAERKSLKGEKYPHYQTSSDSEKSLDFERRKGYNNVNISLIANLGEQIWIG